MIVKLIKNKFENNFKKIIFTFDFIMISEGCTCGAKIPVLVRYGITCPIFFANTLLENYPF